MKITHCGFKRYGRGPVESKRIVLDIRVFAWCMKTGWGA